ncbi:MAG TPA: hypothetical protein VEQ65_11870 [Opitutus sp.]|nr:hypothetical protein [Opitutus sp.]
MHSRSSASAQRIDWAGLVIASLCFVLIVGFYLLRSRDRAGYYAFVREDSVAETIQALCCLASSVVAALASRRLLRVRQKFLAALFALFALGTFALFGEEISWGQRLFGWQTGDYFKATNMQEETNLHNDARLKNVVHPIGIAVGIYAVMSAFLHVSFVRRGAKTLSYFTTEWPVMGFFAVFTAVYAIYEYLNPAIRPWYGFDLVLWQDLEMAETFFTAGILGWTVLKLRSVERMFGACAEPRNVGASAAKPPAAAMLPAVNG